MAAGAVELDLFTDDDLHSQLVPVGEIFRPVAWPVQRQAHPAKLVFQFAVQDEEAGCANLNVPVQLSIDSGTAVGVDEGIGQIGHHDGPRIGAA